MHTNTGPITTEMLKPVGSCKYTSRESDIIIILEGILRVRREKRVCYYGLTVSRLGFDDNNVEYFQVDLCFSS